MVYVVASSYARGRAALMPGETLLLKVEDVHGCRFSEEDEIVVVDGAVSVSVLIEIHLRRRKTGVFAGKMTYMYMGATFLTSEWELEAHEHQEP